MVQSGSIKVNDLKFKLPSVTLANYGTAVPGKYGQIKKLQIVFTGRYEAYLKPIDGKRNFIIAKANSKKCIL